MKDDNTHIHFRRCHICGHLTDQELGLVETCSGCGKVLAPMFYFDERRALGLKSEIDIERMTTSLPRQEYPPIFGLTVYW